MGAQKQEDYENATQCYICRHAFEENNLNRPKVRNPDHITGFFSAPLTASATLSAQ